MAKANKFKAYGFEFDYDPSVDPMPAIELRMAFDKRLQTRPDFYGRFYHLKRGIDLIWNEPRRRYMEENRVAYDPRKNDTFIWNDWSEEMMELFCEWRKETSIGSGNASWKTTCAGLYCLAAYTASPGNTIVVMTTTTLPGLRKRIWKEVLKFHRLGNTGIGYEHPSDYAIRTTKGSDESGIFGVATGQDEGEIQKAVDKIIGFHQTNVIVVLDEGQATNEAILKACLSLEAGTEHFQLIVLGNPDNEMDTLGQVWEPENGYESITVETGRWETKRGGIALHLDCYDCPRVKEGSEYYPGMLTQSDIDSAKKQYGEDSPEFWRTRRGFIAPQGITKTVLTPALIAKFHAREKAIWKSGFVSAAGLDPSYEGTDRCMLRFAHCGEMLNDKIGVELRELVQIKVDATSKEPLHYQIVRQARALCESHDPPVPPERFGLDSTGEGGGLASIAQREWSPAIQLVEFGGRSSDDPVSEHNPKPASQEWLYKVTELWYRFKEILIDDRIRGLDWDTAKQFCQRFYIMRGNLKQLETKRDMKVRSKKSPDEADASVVVTEVLRRTMNLTSIPVVQGDSAWRRFQKKNDINSEDAYLVEA